MLLLCLCLCLGSSLHPKVMYRVNAHECWCLSGGGSPKNWALLWSWPAKFVQRGNVMHLQTWLWDANVIICMNIWTFLLFYRLLCWHYKRRTWRLQPLNMHTFFRPSANWGHLSLHSKSAAIRHHPNDKSYTIRGRIILALTPFIHY